jgi:hypothetical protein
MRLLIPLYGIPTHISDSSTSEVTTKLGNDRVISLEIMEKKLACQGVNYNKLSSL